MAGVRGTGAFRYLLTLGAYPDVSLGVRRPCALGSTLAAIVLELIDLILDGNRNQYIDLISIEAFVPR